MKEKINNFIRCSNKLEAIAKSTFKNPDIDVLFCIIQDEIFVYQGFKLININLEQFAEGLSIDIIEAQAIVGGGAETIAEAKKIIRESIEGFQSEIEESDLIEVVKEEVQDDVKEKIEKVAEGIKEKVQTLTSSGIELLFEELFKKIEELEARVAKLEPKEIEQIEEVVESEQVDENASQKREE